MVAALSRTIRCAAMALTPDFEVITGLPMKCTPRDFLPAGSVISRRVEVLSQSRAFDCKHGGSGLSSKDAHSVRRFFLRLSAALARCFSHRGTRPLSPAAPPAK
jgi:hypothetical protein